MVQSININFAKFNSLIAIAEYFSSEDICKATIAQQRWSNGEAVCPYCGSTHCHKCSDGRYICKSCQNKFSVLVGTIFENTKISLRKWFMAMYLISSHKKGISSCQLARDINVTQKTAWFMMMKWRQAMSQDTVELKGVVSMDEAYLGGSWSNRPLRQQQAIIDQFLPKPFRTSSLPKSAYFKINSETQTVEQVTDEIYKLYNEKVCK